MCVIVVFLFFLECFEKWSNDASEVVSALLMLFSIHLQHLVRLTLCKKFFKLCCLL